MIQCLQPRRLDLGHHSQQTPTWTKANRLSTYTHLPFVYFEFFCTNRLSKQGSHVLFSIDLPQTNVTLFQDILEQYDYVTEYEWFNEGFSAYGANTVTEYIRTGPKKDATPILPRNIHNQTSPLTASYAAKYSASPTKSATVLCMELFQQITQLLRHTQTYSCYHPCQTQNWSWSTPQVLGQVLHKSTIGLNGFHHFPKCHTWVRLVSTHYS